MICHATKERCHCGAAPSSGVPCRQWGCLLFHSGLYHPWRKEGERNAEYLRFRAPSCKASSPKVSSACWHGSRKKPGNDTIRPKATNEGMRQTMLNWATTAAMTKGEVARRSLRSMSRSLKRSPQEGLDGNRSPYIRLPTLLVPNYS